MSVTISVINEKGGAGKSVTAINLAFGLAELKSRVLLVDFDPACSITKWLTPEIPEESVVDALLSKRAFSDVTVKTSNGSVDLMPSNRELEALQYWLHEQNGSEYFLKNGLDQIRSNYDHIIIDNRPNFGKLPTMTLLACDWALIPTKTRSTDLDGLYEQLLTIDEIRQNNRKMQWRIVLVDYDKREGNSKTVEAFVKKHQSKAVLKTIVRHNTDVSQLPQHETPVLIYAPRKAGAADYRALTREVKRIMK